RSIGALPEQAGMTRRRYRIQDVPKLGHDKSGVDHPVPTANEPCRQSLPSPALPVRPIARVIAAAAIDGCARRHPYPIKAKAAQKGAASESRDAKYYRGQKCFAPRTPGLFSPNFAPSPGRVLLWQEQSI